MNDTFEALAELILAHEQWARNLAQKKASGIGADRFSRG